jgi:hypothetical protein
LNDQSKNAHVKMFGNSWSALEGQFSKIKGVHKKLQEQISFVTLKVIPNFYRKINAMKLE